MVYYTPPYHATLSYNDYALNTRTGQSWRPWHYTGRGRPLRICLNVLFSLDLVNLETENKKHNPKSHSKNLINQDEILSKLPKSFTDYNIDKNPNLVQKYFEKSRLSHIANWRTEFIQYVANQNTKKQVLPPAEWVIHIDMDCFFVAIARKLNPSLLNKPVAVCYSKSKTTNWGQGTFKTNSYSEIASCSYRVVFQKCHKKVRKWLKMAKNDKMT